MFSRVPRWGDITVQCDFRNNVIYDWGHTCGYGDLRTLNYVNNYVAPRSLHHAASALLHH